MPEIERPTQNSARTTREYPVPPEELHATLRRAVENLSGWTLESVDEAGLRAVRKTRVFRFRDDVEARVETTGGGSRVELSSASRLGRSDLGQNPRNLRELLDAVEREITS